jgi:glycosyltransferase involved in cell wall biosynthesis
VSPTKPPTTRTLGRASRWMRTIPARRVALSSSPRLAVVHNNVDQGSSIGKLASWAVRTALAAGIEVTVVARDLEESLHHLVEWRRLYVPPRIHAVQWAAARPTISRALRGSEVDLVHVFQPQVAALADTWHVQFLSQVALEMQPPRVAQGMREHMRHWQHHAVAAMEGTYLRRLGPRPTVLFCSELVEREFIRLYGKPRRTAVLYNPAPPIPPSPAAGAARRRLDLPVDVPLVGFLGGLDERKGYATVSAAVARMPTAHLLMGGPRSDGFVDNALGARLHVAGMLTDLRDFWASIDVLAVPSVFDPFSLVVTEASAHGIPSVVGPHVGAADLICHHGAGMVATPDSFGQALETVTSRLAAFKHGAEAFAAALSEERQGALLLSHWEARLACRSR